MLQNVTAPEIKIEKGVPLSASHEAVQKYPFDKMGVGDSFFTPRKQTAMGGVISHFRKKYPDRKFAIRKVDGGTRIWRTA
jgi:hypothetical protein